MAKVKKGDLAERLKSRKLWFAIGILAIGLTFRIFGMLDKDLVTLLALIFIGYTAGNVGAKFAYMKYG